uniref:Zinc finger CCCH-type containing 18 n=1 Tax=Erpetoichthys calabaricus TaxID=27687 RepID=A0A8C4S171_ERPCA
MDVSESPNHNPKSPEEEQHNSDSELLKDDIFSQNIEEGRDSDLEDDEVERVSDQEELESEEEMHNEAKYQDSDNDERQGKTVTERDTVEEHEKLNDLKDESSSVTRDLDEHELDYDEEVPEEQSTVAPEEELRKAGGEDGEDEEEEEDDEEEEEEEEENADAKQKKDKSQPKQEEEVEETEKKLEEQKVPERIRRDSIREKKKDDDDGEIDDGEIDDDDLEEGEVKDPSDRKIRPRPICKFFMRGHCTWGMNCRFIHPGLNDKGNYSLITKPDPFSPNGGPPAGPLPLIPTTPWGGPVVEEVLPPPPPIEPPAESAWERGLRHAKEVLKKATLRKEQEPDFEEKRFNVTIGEDDRDFDKENDFFRERNYRITREVRDPGNDPYADPYYDYEMECFYRGGQYENFRVQYTEPEPYHYRERERERDTRERQRERERERERDRERERRQRERERERERERDKERQRRKEEWERDRMKRDEKERPREREREREKEKEKPKPRSPPPPRQTEAPPKKEIGLPLIKRPDEWKDPWRRSKSPKKKLGVSGSPNRGRRRHRPSGSSVSLSNSSRYLRIFNSVKYKSLLKINMILNFRSLSVSSVSSVSSASSSSSSIRSADSEDMYADLASPVSSASSHSPTPAQQKKEKGKPKKEEPLKEERKKQEPPPQPARPSSGQKTGASSKTSQQHQAPPQVQSGYGSHKDIKLTLLNKQAEKGNRKRYQPSDKERPASPVSKRIALSPERGQCVTFFLLESMQNSLLLQFINLYSNKNILFSFRKRPLSPQPKVSGKASSVSNKPPEAAAAPAPKSGKASTLSRREELLKQLKAVEDAIARKRAKIPGKA